MSSKRTLAPMFLSLFLPIAWTGPASASLIGDTVDCSFEGGNFSCSPESATVDASASEFKIGSSSVDYLDVDVAESSFTLTGLRDLTYRSDIFTLSGLDWIGSTGSITGFNLVNDGVNGITDDDITFGADFVEIDFRAGSGEQLTTFFVGRSITVGLITSHTPVPVPVPATLFLFGLGLAGIGFGLRRRERHIA